MTAQSLGPRHSLYGDDMSRICLTIICLLGCVLLTGCEPVMRELQYTNAKTGLFPMNMQLAVGQGKVDAGRLIDTQAYDGTVDRPGVLVHYPKGMGPLAGDVASAFRYARMEVEEITGIAWAFDLDLYLIPVEDISQGFRLKIPLREDRMLRMPILVSANGIVPEWSRGIGHEITEASMLASLERRELVLGDYCIWGSGIVNETRWFRDGVADYAGDILNEQLFGDRYQVSPRIYSDLAQVRGNLLDWSNCEGMIGPDVYYSASQGLIHELINRSGEDAIARIMQAASREKYINGSTLKHAVKEATGINLEEFLKDYRPPID